MSCSDTRKACNAAHYAVLHFANSIAWPESSHRLCIQDSVQLVSLCAARGRVL